MNLVSNYNRTGMIYMDIVHVYGHFESTGFPSLESRRIMSWLNSATHDMDDSDVIRQALTGLIDTEAVAKQWEQAFKNVKYLFIHYH